MKIHKVAQRRTRQGSYYIAHPRHKVYDGPMPPEARHIKSIKRIYDRSMGRFPPDIQAPTPQELNQEMRRRGGGRMEYDIYWVPGFNRSRIRVHSDAWQRALRENLENPFAPPGEGTE